MRRIRAGRRRSRYGQGFWRGVWGDRAETSGQLEFPRLSNQILSETVMRLFAHQPEASGLIDSMCGRQNALSPESYPSVSGGSSEGDTFVHQCAAEPVAAGCWMYVKQSQPRHFRLIRMAHQKDVSHMTAVHLGDPAALAGCIEVSQEIRHDSRYQSFKGFVPTKLFDISGPLKLNH